MILKIQKKILKRCKICKKGKSNSEMNWKMEKKIVN